MNKLTISLALMAATAFAGTANYPGDYCCRLYRDPFYEGQVVDVCLDDPSNPKAQLFDMRDYGMEYAMSSYICGAKVSYDICTESDRCGNGSGSYGAGTEWNFNMGTSSNRLLIFKMRPYDASEHGAVIVYNNADCSDVSGRYYANKDTSVATYNLTEFKARNGRDNSVSSVKVPFGYTAYLYESDGFHGKEWVIQG